MIRLPFASRFALIFTFSCLWVGSLASPAAAGFKWVSPVAGGEAPIAAAPLPTNDDPVLVIDGAAYQPVQTPSTMQQVPAVPRTSSYVAPAPMPSGVVEGFADNVPLSVALRQIVPQTHGFSVDQGVDMNRLVSWRGGQNWQQVLETSLKAVGLKSVVDGQMVRITSLSDVPMPVVTAAPPVPVMQSSVDAVPGATDIKINSVEPAIVSTAAAPVAPAVVTDDFQPSYDGKSWRAEAGRNLRDVLAEWSRQENVELVWSSDYDFPIEASLTAQGSFEEAVRQVLRSFAKAKPQPFGRLHSNPAVNQRVLVIETRGNNYGE